MPTPRFSIRVDPAELEGWRTKAEAQGLSITAWIRQRCNTDTTPPVATPSKRKPPVATPKRSVSGRQVTPRFKT